MNNQARVTLIAFYTIVVKEIRRFLRIWPQTLLPSAITMILYFTIFGKLIGARIGEMGGISYMLFIIPGLVMMAVINNAYSNTVGSFYGSKFQYNLEEMLVAPVPNYIIILGFAIGGIVRGLLIGIIVLALAWLFADFSFHHIGLMLLIVLLSAALFAMAGLTNAIFAKSMDDINIVPIFILAPLSYLGGVFYSLDILPGYLQTISYANPIVYMVNAFRYGMLGISDIPVIYALTFTTLFTVLLFFINVYLLKNSTRTRS